MIKNDRISEKKLKAIELLMQSYSPGEVAAEVGISRVTVYRWLKDEDFNAELDNQKSELIKRSSRKLAGALDQAADVLIDLLKTKNPNVRRLAAGNIFDYCFKFSDITDIENRIKALEDTIKK